MGHLQIDYRHSQTHVVQSLTKNVSNIFFITIWLRYKMCACQVTRGATSQESIILIIKVPIILTETESLRSWVWTDGRVVSYLLSGGETSETSETSCWQHLTLWEPLRGGRWLDISVCGLQWQSSSQCCPCQSVGESLPFYTEDWQVGAWAIIEYHQFQFNSISSVRCVI